jgi:CDP-diacylglycerol--serine O-phosphatidyltransferase
MVSHLPMMALKFKNLNIKKLMPFIILLIIAVTGAFIFNWLAGPISFVAYVILSLIYKQQKKS